MPRPRDLRAVLDVLRAARERRLEPEAWATGAIDALRDALPARVGILGVSRGFAPGARAVGVLTVRRGWTDPAKERVWLDYATTPVMRTPEYHALVSFEGAQITRLRDQLWPRDAWYRSRTWLDVHEPAGLDDSVISIRRNPPHILSIWMHRAPGDPPVTRREWWILHLATAELAGMLDDVLALPRGDLDALTPRQRQTLERLLAGDSEKQAALALGVARSTLHEHVLALYRHFEVSSRSELLARFVHSPFPPAP